MLLPDETADPKAVPALILVLCDRKDEQELDKLAEKWGLEKAAESGEAAVAMPVPDGACWETSCGANLSTDEKMIYAFLHQGNDFLEGVHPMPGRHFLACEGSGSRLAVHLCAEKADFQCAAGLYLQGCGRECAAEARRLIHIPAVVNGTARETVDALTKACDAVWTEEKTAVNPRNPVLRVEQWDDSRLQRDGLWKGFFCKLRRMNTSPAGDSAEALPLPQNAQWRKEKLEDGLEHEWLEIPPEDTVKSPIPLMIVSHGMGDSPAGAAMMTEMHRIGQREGFLAVYPRASDGMRWNLDGSENQPDDVAFYDALICRLKRERKIDGERIYTCGFSNGAGMAMLYALSRPETVAACCPIDSTFPYASARYFRPGERIAWLAEEGEAPKAAGGPPPMNEETALAPLRKALAEQRKREKPIRLPVMYFYGTRESEYPVREGSNQSLCYRFWKEFNGIANRNEDEKLPPDEAVGVSGDRVEELRPDARYPGHRWTDHCFFNDEGLDAYHFVLMHGKAHEAHPAEAEMGWAYVSRFRRKRDGGLEDTELTGKEG